MRTVILAFALVLAPFLSGNSLAADAARDPAAQQVESFYAVLLDCMKHGKELGFNGRYEKLKPAVEQAYGLPLMTGLSVGPSWSSQSAADQQALIAAFERMTIASYASNFDSNGGEKFIVDPAAQTRGTDKLVQSRLVTSKETIPFNYRMRQIEGSWKIIDVYLNGTISELAIRRSDFASTISSGGAAALIKKINELSDKLMKS